MNTYKILFITDAWYPQTNGVVRTMDSLGNELKKLGHEVHYITPLDFITVPCPTYPEIKLAIKPWPKLYKKIKSINPQIIHISTEGPIGWFARRYCIKNKIKFTTSYHTKFPEYIYERIRLPVKFTYKFMKYFHKNSSNVLVTTESMKEELADNGFDIEKLKVWTRGVKHEVFSSGIKIQRKLKTPIWIYVGRVAIEKNIKAFLDLDIEGSKIIVGGGPQLNELKKKYKDVLFTGMLKDDEIASYLASSDVFVFPSKTDTFGIVIIEALSAGLPIAGYPVPGPKDIVGNSEINTLDWDLKKSALKALTIDKDKCRQLSKKYTWENCAKIFLENVHPNY